MTPRWRIFIVLWLLGVAGVMSFLLIDLHALIAMLPLPQGQPAELPPPIVLKIATVAQPTVFVTIATVAGLFLAGKVGLHAPAIEAWARREGFVSRLTPQIVPGVVAGLLCGIGLIGLWMAFTPLLTKEFAARVEEFNKFIPAVIRFLYGGFTEEILLRWGLMTFLVWVFWKVIQKGIGEPSRIIVIAAIMISALIFAAGHLPIAIMLAGEANAVIVAFVIAGNSLFGIVAGFLYWKKGLESAMIAHIAAHAVLVTAMNLKP